MATKPKSIDAVETAMASGKTQFEKSLKVSAEATTKQFEKAMETSKKQMDEGMKMLDEVGQLAKGNIEALVASSQAAAKAAEEMSKEVADYSRRSLEQSTETMRTLSSVKNMKEFVDLSNDSMKKHYEGFIEEASKLSEMSLKLMGDVFEPLSTRFATASETFAKRTAA